MGNERNTGLLSLHWYYSGCVLERRNWESVVAARNARSATGVGACVLWVLAHDV